MNEERRRNEELQRQRRQFADMVMRGQVSALDRFSRPIREGDRIMVRTDIDLIYDVVSVNPVLDPKMQPGLLTVNLTVSFPLQVIGNVPYMQAHIIGRGKIEAEKPGAEQNNGAGDPQAGEDAQSQDPPGPKLVTPPIDEPPT